MANVHSLGFPRIGKRRELKFALEAYWNSKITKEELLEQGKVIRAENWALQKNAGMTLLPVGDFAWYDQVLNTSLMLGVIPKRHRNNEEVVNIDTAFRIARGRAPSGCACAASDMTKWFNTNYHYIVPELSEDQSFRLTWTELFEHTDEAQQLGYNVKPVLIGPVTYLYLSKCANSEFDKLSLLPALLTVYQEVIAKLAAKGVEWVQIDEPILALELDDRYRDALKTSVTALNGHGTRLLLASYFDSVLDYYDDIASYPVQGVHFDCVAANVDFQQLHRLLRPEQILSLGVVSGRNIWRSDLASLFAQLNPIYLKRSETLRLAPCYIPQLIWNKRSS